MLYRHDTTLVINCQTVFHFKNKQINNIELDYRILDYDFYQNSIVEASYAINFGCEYLNSNSYYSLEITFS